METVVKHRIRPTPSTFTCDAWMPMTRLIIVGPAASARKAASSMSPQCWPRLRDAWVDVTLVVVWKRSASSVGDHSNPDMYLLSGGVSRARADNVFECVQLEFVAPTVSKREATLQLPGSVHPQQGQSKSVRDWLTRLHPFAGGGNTYCVTGCDPASSRPDHTKPRRRYFFWHCCLTVHLIIKVPCNIFVSIYTKCMWGLNFLKF